MARRPRRPGQSQKGHGHKRPRAFHRGRHAGREQAPALEPLTRAEARAAEVDAELAADRAETSDHAQVWRSLRRAAPEPLGELVPPVWP